MTGDKKKDLCMSGGIRINCAGAGICAVSGACEYVKGYSRTFIKFTNKEITI